MYFIHLYACLLTQNTQFGVGGEFQQHQITIAVSFEHAGLANVRTIPP